MFATPTMMSALAALAVLGGMAVFGMAASAREQTRAVNAGRPEQEEHGVRLMTLDPGHFHAALVQKEMYPGVAARVDVYAPLGPDLLQHLARISSYNHRAGTPTSWRMEVHTGPDYVERMLREHPGNVVVLSGRNRGKIERIKASVDAGLNVLGDNPWILDYQDFPALEATLADADRRHVIAYDIMTERFEITTILQKALVNDPAVFGVAVPGTDDDPGVYMESVHFLMKEVSGAPNIRPAWFFDTAEQGEGLNDIGTHLVDLVQWTLFPAQPIDYRTDVRVLSAQRWPTMISRQQFERVTKEPDFPESLSAAVKNGQLEYFCNSLVSYTVKGVHTKLNVIWDWEPPAGSGDTHFAFYRGTRSRVEVRQSHEPGFRPELYVIPSSPAEKAQVLAAVQATLASLQDRYPGVAADVRGDEIHVTIPDAFRVGHEAHFAQVTNNFLGYLRNPDTLPSWERPNMLAKYYVTTKGVELSHHGPPRPARRIAR
jgi:predicted dehydrogenase